MRTTSGLNRRNRAALRCTLVAVVAVVGAAALPTPALAITAASGSMSMSSEAGDFVGQGQAYSYATSAGDVLTSSGDGNAVQVDVSGANGDFWTLAFAAPGGQLLTAGTYSNATRWPFQSPGEPGLSIFGNGRGCNTLTGSFVVSNVSFGANSYLQSFDASFVQHCEGGTPALSGEVHVVNPPAPQALLIGLAFSSQGSVARATGVATVRGTVTCNQPTSVFVSGNLSQRVNRFSLASGSFSVEVACTGAPTTWQAAVAPSGSVPFGTGSAQLDATASAFDANYGQQVTASKTGAVKLGR
jgi:hypothetical protein